MLPNRAAHHIYILRKRILNGFLEYLDVFILQEWLYYFRIKTYVKTLPTVNKIGLLYEILKFLKRSIWYHLHLIYVPKINSKLYWLCQLELIKILRMSDNRSSFSTAGNLFPYTNNISVEIWHLYSYYEKNELTVTDKVNDTLSHMTLPDFL